MENNNEFRLTPSWMSQKYDEMNAWLFNGKLGYCDFGIFTKGSGSGGKTLGYFTIEGRGILIKRRTRRIFKQDYYGYEEYIDSDNFDSLCKPAIRLNGNYIWTEKAALNVLVHEMCHYYTYMDGYAPVQAHGTEFRHIGMIVSGKSGGMFTIERLANAETMNGIELNDEMRQRKERREENKKASSIAVFVFLNNGEIRLVKYSNQQSVEAYVSSWIGTGTINKIVVSNDRKFIDFLYNLGYRQNMRGIGRYWLLNKETRLDSILDELEKSTKKTYYDTDDNDGNSYEETKREPKRIFTIKTSTGVFEVDFNGSYNILKNKLRERFPKMSEETIEKIMNNKNNYRIEESKKRKTDYIIEKVIKEFVDKKRREEKYKDDSVEVIPGMNLGITSPLENEY